MVWLQPFLIFTVRTILGLLMGVSLSFLGVGIGWVSYVFFGASSLDTLLILFMGGASVGAAGGGFLSWLNLDYNTPMRLLAKALVLVIAAVGGAWGGYQYGSVQDVPCCARADITPITYIVLGATVGANIIALLLGITRQAMPSLRRQLALGKIGQ